MSNRITVAAAIFVSSLAIAATAHAQALPTDRLAFDFAEVEQRANGIDVEIDEDGCTLWVHGDDGGNIIVISLDDDDRVLVNEQPVAIGRAWATAGDVCSVLVHGAGGNDVLVDHSGLGAELAGGAGLDVRKRSADHVLTVGWRVEYPRAHDEEQDEALREGVGA